MPDNAEPPVQGGLITQRMAVERGRRYAVWCICVGVFLCVFGLRLLLEPADTWVWWLVVVGAPLTGVANIVLGLSQLKVRARRIAQFDAEHGPEAGKQPWVGK